MGALTVKGGTEKAGDIKFHAVNAVPAGWMKANGAAVNRTIYSALFAVIGTTYGAGDGATSFNLPDLRGEFVRGFDDARGVDSGRVIGSAQAGAIESHTHTETYVNTTLGTGTIDGASGSNPNSTKATGATGGTETRPRNVAMLACIKY